MNDTPRTDEWFKYTTNLVDDVEFARRLERELNEWKKIAYDLQSVIRLPSMFLKQKEILAKFDKLYNK